MSLSQYLKIYPCPDRPGTVLVYSTKRSSSVLLSEDALQAVRDGTVTGEERATLERLGICVENPEVERREMAELFLRVNGGRRPFSCTVVLNLDCNLACPYCYEGNFRSRTYMTTETAGLVVAEGVRYLMDGRNVSIVFYGGEPLLSLDIIRRISLPLREAASRNGSSYTFSLVTNGTLLTRRHAEELVPLGLTAAKVTIDGPRRIHDVSRPFIGGRGSFDLIISNILDTWDLFSLQVGGNFTSENWRAFPLLLDELVDRGVTPEKIAGITFSPVSPKAGERGVADFGGECTVMYEPWLCEASLALRQETLERGFAVARPRLSACMVEFADSLVIGCDGALYKCPVFMGYEELKVGMLGEEVADYRESHGLDVWRREECLACSYLPLCFGGCRFMTLLRKGTIDDVDCRKELLDATLETMVRQDLLFRGAFLQADNQKVRRIPPSIQRRTLGKRKSS